MHVFRMTRDRIFDRADLDLPLSPVVDEWMNLGSKKTEHHQLELELVGLSFTCGSSLQEQDLPALLMSVCGGPTCFDQVEGTLLLG